MKKTFLLLMALLLLVPAMASAYDYSITFAWDPNSPAPDGYRFFNRKAGDNYNYAQGAEAWKGPETQITLDFQCAEGQECVTYHVVRAYVLNDESGDSNEVSYTFDGVKPDAPGAFTAAYDKATKQITFTWSQTNQAKIERWVFFMKDNDDSSSTYKAVASVNGDTAPVDLTYQTALDLPAKLNHVQFTAVAFNKSSVWGDEATPVVLEINLAPPLPNNTLRINVVKTKDVHPYLQ